MLTETSYTISDLPSELRDLDLAESDEWVGVTDHHVVFQKGAVKLPKPISYPKVAAIDSETAVVVNCRSRRGESNVWVIAANGNVLASFFAGDAIEDVLASDRFVVVTYFDEGACTSPGIEGNGVTIFDTRGNYLFAYRERFGPDAVDIADCYSACWAEKNQIYFFPYTDFPVVRLDLENRVQEKWAAPSQIHGAGAISSKGATIYFHGPYSDKSGIYSWRIGDEPVERIGERHWQLRGIRSGRFIVVGKTGFTILSPSP